MEACLGEELPAPTELEEALRNGVILAKLGHRFAPTAVALKKIFDPEQQRYQVRDRGAPWWLGEESHCTDFSRKSCSSTFHSLQLLCVLDQ